MTFEKGDRFEARHERDEGKVIEIREVLSPSLAGTPRYRAQTEVHPKNPTAVGRYATLSEKSLRHSYKKISR